MKFECLKEHKICHRTWAPGSIIETDEELTKRNRPTNVRFKEVDEETPVTPPLRAKYRFELLAGTHAEEPNWIPDVVGNMIPDSFHPSRTYYKGATIETDERLDYKFDKTSSIGNRKFRLMDENNANMTKDQLLEQRKALDEQIAKMDNIDNTDLTGTAASDKATLMAMEIDELRKVAKSEGIDLGNLQAKEKICDKIIQEMAKLTGVK